MRGSNLSKQLGAIFKEKFRFIVSQRTSVLGPASAQAFSTLERGTVKIRLHSFLSDVLFTGVTQALILGASLYLVGSVSRKMGLVALGEYLLLKRVSAWLLTGTQLGFGIALPREIARSVQDTERRARQYFAAAIVTVTPLLALLTSLAVVAAKPLSVLCFGTPNAPLVYSMAVLLVGSAVQSLAFGYYRGLQRMRQANLIQLGGSVVLPLMAFVLLGSARSTPLLIGVTGAGMLIVSLVWALPILIRVRDFVATYRQDVKTLLRYGIVRVPGDLADGALLALGPVLITHRTNMAEVSFLLLGTTCLTMTSLAFWPVVMMLLAKVSSLLGAGRMEDVRGYVQHLRSAVVQISCLVMTQALIFAPALVLWWLGPAYLPGVSTIRILMCAIPGLMYYYGLRSVLDAASPFAYNTRNLLIALTAFGLIAVPASIFAPGHLLLNLVAFAMTFSIYLLAIATNMSLQKLDLARSLPQWKPLWVVAIVAATSLAVQMLVRFQTTRILFVAIELANTTVLFLLLRRWRPEWIAFLNKMVLTKRAA